MAVNPREAYASCPYLYGVPYDPSDTQHRTERGESDLGRVFKTRGPDGKDRWVKILKNASGGSLTARHPVTSSTSAGRYGIDAGAASTDDAVRVLGVVEEGYGAGVPNGYWFRAVVEGPMGLILDSANDTQNDLTVGRRLVTAADTGTVWGVHATTTVDEALNCLGWALETTTKVTDAGAVFDAYVKIQD